jgi:hypothetical protein
MVRGAIGQAGHGAHFPRGWGRPNSNNRDQRHDPQNNGNAGARLPRINANRDFIFKLMMVKAGTVAHP